MDIQENDLSFNWYIVIDYHYANNTINKVEDDNRRLRYVLRKFFKSNIRFWFFNEVHRYSHLINGGIHKNIMMEGIPDHCWKERSSQMNQFLLELDPSGKLLFECECGIIPTVQIQKDLLNKVIRGFNRSIPNGSDALSIERISESAGGQMGLVEYCTKDYWKHHENIGNVLDTFNSDAIDRDRLCRGMKLDGNYFDLTKHQRIFAMT